MAIQEITALRAQDVMVKRVEKLEKDVSIMEALKKLYVSNIGALVVVEKDGAIAGIFTERDILRRVIPKGINMEETPVSQVMTAGPVTAQVQTPVMEVYEAMSGMNFRHVPIVDGKNVVGIISIKDIAKACMKIAQS